MRSPLLFDCHLDLSLNGLEYNRDLRLPVHEIRKREAGMKDLKGRAAGTTAFPEMRAARMGLCVATQLAGCMKGARPIAGWMSPHQAWAQTQGQLSWYHAMEEEGQMKQVSNVSQLDAAVALWESDAPDEAKPICYILSLEGADSIRTVGHLEQAWQQGLRALGPAHYGVCRYAMGHDMEGGLPPAGRELVKEMDRLGIILDVTHLSDDCFWDALEIHTGALWASHSNCRALVPDPRQFSDEQLRAIIQRGGVIGAALDAWMMIPGWVRGTTTPQQTGLKLEVLCDHIDHVCQLAGNALHAGIGTDLDGGYGTEQTPEDLDTITDVARLGGMLARRGYSPADVDQILHGNYLRLLRTHWSQRGLQ
jgi:membrane dipeptidase